MNTVIIIPARMQSERLPGKPLADIAGKPMIVHVLERAKKAQIGEVYVACAEQDIVDAVEKAGGNAVLTNPDHASGTDRIYEALHIIDPEKQYDTILNVQGDLPTIEPSVIAEALIPLKEDNVDISTLTSEITDETEIENPNVVKVILSLKENQKTGRALYFTRATAPHGMGPLYHHVGLYGYTRNALERFVTLPPSSLEKRENLEQLRALEAHMVIGVQVIDTVPFGVDTKEDLEKARALLG